MSDIDKYRKGYEDMKAEIDKVKDDDPILGAAERAVKSLNPMDFVREFTRNDDEQKGREDALNGKEFNPGEDDDD